MIRVVRTSDVPAEFWKGWIAPREASTRFRLSLWQIYRYARSGRIAAIRPNGGRRILVDGCALAAEFARRGAEADSRKWQRRHRVFGDFTPRGKALHRDVPDPEFGQPEYR